MDFYACIVLIAIISCIVSCALQKRERLCSPVAGESLYGSLVSRSLTEDILGVHMSDGHRRGVRVPHPPPAD